MSVVLAEAVERAVGAAFTALNGDVERLVDEEVDRRLGQLVADRLTVRNELGIDLGSDLMVDGEARPEKVRASDLPPPPKTCRACSQEKPADQYDQHRRVCKQCRRERVRANADRAASEADRPGAAAQHD